MTENLMKREEPTIALDYDGTTTTNIDFWVAFIHNARAAGYNPIIVTMRTPEEAQEIDARVLNTGIRVVATSRKAKHDFLEPLGIEPVIWIEDQPAFIFVNAQSVEEERQQE